MSREELQDRAENTLAVVSKMADAYRKEITYQASLGHDRLGILAALAQEMYDDHDEQPWEIDDLIGVFCAALFLLGENRIILDQMSAMLPLEGSRRVGGSDG